MSEQVENEQPFSLRLVRRDQERRMARFYTMHLAPTLFGGWDLVREWGRIGSPGTVRIDPFETLEESERALRRIEKQKRKRGYLSRRTEVQLTITGPAPSPENGSLAK